MLIYSLLLVGCATTTTPSAEVRPISRDQILAPRYFQRTDAKQIEILIKRDQGLVGSGSGIVFSIEGQPVAKLGAGQGARIYLKPGHYLFGVLPTVNLGFSTLMEMEADVEAGIPQVYRIYTDYGSNNAVHISRTSE